MILDFRNAKTVEDVEKVFKKNKNQLEKSKAIIRLARKVLKK